MSNLYIGLVVLVGLLTTILLLRFILGSSSNLKEVFHAVDGTKFSRKKDLKEYEFLYERLKYIYEENPLTNQSKQNTKLGLTVNFIQQLKADGFANPNLLISNKEQFKKLVELFDIAEMSSDSGSLIEQ
tara:strand:- start:929 stop:1315 length:387 start_codon:yes stop_codon:yes gene_type:complete